MRIQLNPKSAIDTIRDALLSANMDVPFDLEKSYASVVVAYVCPECEGELLGKWDNYLLRIDPDERKKYSDFANNVIINEIKAAQNLKKCPFCGGTLSHERGFYLEGSTALREAVYGLEVDKLANNGITVNKYGREVAIFDGLSHIYRGVEKSQLFDLIFPIMKEEREKAEKEFAEKKSQNLALTYDQTIISSKSEEEITAIKNTPSKLRDFLQNLIKMEMNIYAVTNHLTSLYFLQFDTHRKATAAALLPFYEKVQEKENEYQLFLAKVDECRKAPFTLPAPIQPPLPVYQQPGLFNKKKVEAENAALHTQYQFYLNQYQQAMYQYEAQKAQFMNDKERAIAELLATAENKKQEITAIQASFQEQSNAVSTPLSSAKAMIDKEVADNEEMLQKLFDCRNNLYAYNIVFEKYRNAVAMSTFYEYLMSGRCTTLEGADGAYNLYENEIRANRIIGQLSQVIEKLDNISEGQYMICSEIKKVNTSLNHLNNTMDTALVSIQNMDKNIADIAVNTDVIAHNTAVSAYYSKLNAELTNALGFMVALK